MFFFSLYGDHRYLHVLTHSFPTRRSSDLDRSARGLDVALRRRGGRRVRRRLGQGHRAGRAGVDVRRAERLDPASGPRSEEHTSELQSLMRISYAVFCLKKKTRAQLTGHPTQNTTKNSYSIINKTQD